MNTNPFHQLTPNNWESIAMYLSKNDFASLALTCQQGKARVDKLKELELMKRRPAARYLSFADIQPQVDIPLTKSDWPLVDVALPVDGLWMFVVYQSDMNVDLHIYRRTTLSPLRYESVRQALFTVPLQNRSKFIVGLDNDRERPGIFFMASGDEFFSYHLDDDQPVKLPLPFHIQDVNQCVIHGSRDQIKCYIPGDHVIQGIVMNTEGVIHPHTEEYPLTFLTAGRLALSPNNRSLLVFDEDYSVLNVIDFKSGEYHVRTCHTMDASAPFSISDDGFNIFTNEHIRPIKPNDIVVYFSNPNVEVSDQARLVHSGNGRIAFKFKNGNLRQILLEQSPYSVQVLTAIFHVSIYTSRLNLYEHHAGRMENFFKIIVKNSLSQKIEVIRAAIPHFDAGILAKLTDYFPEITIQALCCIADYLLLTDINRQHAHPDCHTTRLHGTKVVAQSGFRNRYCGSIQEDVMKYSREIPTAELGTVRSPDLFFGSHHDIFHPNSNTTSSYLVGRYATTYMRSKKQKLFAKIQGDRYANVNKSALLGAALPIRDTIRVADAACLSRNPKLDRLLKKLIPDKLGKALKHDPKMRHSIYLDAVLLKVIGWLSNGKYKSDLEDARLRIIDAVRANPSLEYDPNQLWHTSFFGKPSLDSCLKDPRYRQQIMNHFNIDPQYSMAPEPNKSAPRCI